MKHLPINHLHPRNPPVTRRLQLQVEPTDGRSKTVATDNANDLNAIAAAIRYPDVISVIFLGIIACLIAVNLILRFPGAGLLIARFNEFL